MHSLEGLVCPKCHEPLTTNEAGRELRCARHGSRYPLIDGIPSFMTSGGDAVALPGCALSLVIPALNEATNLERILPVLGSALAALGPTCEIIVVDGGSTDGTQEVVRKHDARLVILNITFRRGLSLPVNDLSSGFRLYRRTVLRELKLTATDFDVLEEILIRALAAGYRVVEVPFRYRARVAGRSHARLVKFALSYLRTFLAM